MILLCSTSPKYHYKKTSALLEFYFRCRFWPVHRHGHDILHWRTKIYRNRSYDIMSISQDGGRQPYWISCR